jgi:hypothetical protein
VNTQIKTDDGPLPSQFEDLKRFVPAWAIPSRDDRVEKRLTASMDEINEFYNGLTPRLNDVLGFLNQYEMKTMPDDVHRLFLLTLSLAQVHPAVENFGQQEVVDGWDMRQFRIFNR